MERFENLKKICIEFGHKEEEDICEFWFKNQKELQTKLYGPKAWSTTPGYILRWKTDFGKKYEAAIRTYINEKVENNLSWQHNNQDGAIPNISYAIIDFADFRFKFDGHEYHPDKLPNTHFKKHIWPDFDLNGIDLSNISLKFCTIKTCSLTNVNFDNAYFFETTFDNCCLNASSFRQAQIIQVNFIKSSIISVDFTNASLSNINRLADKTVFLPFIYNKVSLRWLLGVTIKKLVSHKTSYSPTSKIKHHTHFGSNDVSGLTIAQLKPLKEYISWYQLVLLKITLLHEVSLKRRILFLLELLTTKYWSSYTALATSAIIVNLIFSLIIFFNYSDFHNLNHDFFQAFYYSVVTFTTLGYGDIHPQGHLAQIIVILDVIMGYIILGLFIFLISRKIDKAF